MRSLKEENSHMNYKIITISSAGREINYQDEDKIKIMERLEVVCLEKRNDNQDKFKYPFIFIYAGDMIHSYVGPDVRKLTSISSKEIINEL